MCVVKTVITMVFIVVGYDSKFNGIWFGWLRTYIQWYLVWVVNEVIQWYLVWVVNTVVKIDFVCVINTANIMVLGLGG